jgi:acetyl esterase
MPLDLAVRRFLATKPDAGSPDDPPAVRRTAILEASDRLFEQFGQGAPLSPSPVEHTVSHALGSVRILVYRPGAVVAAPLHVFVHGGGFWLGSADELVVDATCRERSVGAGCVVVSVDYRLAPEHRFPTAVEDCVAAVLWAVDHAASLGADADNVSIGGVSAGANIAAAAAIALRDRNGPQLRLQLLEVPVLDLTLETMRASGVGDEFGITSAEMQTSADMYLPEAGAARAPLASPLLAADLSRLPPARILTAEFDPLRDDGARYADRLRAAGVAANHSQQPGAVHGSLLLTDVWPSARTWRAEVIAALQSAHGAPPAPDPRRRQPSIEGGN